jgi:hypothetical protein
MSAQLASSHPFPLLGAASLPTDIAMPLCRVTLSFHVVQMSSLPSLYLPATLHPITSSLEPKSKHLIHTIVTGYPLRTIRLPPFTDIKMSSQPWSPSSPLNRVSILSPP